MTTVFVIATDRGFVSYDDYGNLHCCKAFSVAEPYYSYDQASIAARNLGIQPFWILTERKENESA